jgi:hypothetical protein
VSTPSSVKRCASRGRQADRAAVDRQVEGEQLDAGERDAAHQQRAAQARDREQIECAARLRLLVVLCLADKLPIQYYQQGRQQGNASEQGEGGVEARELDAEAGERRPDESGERAAEGERGEIARARGGVAERADQVVHRDVEEDMPQADQRRRREEQRQAAAGERQREAGGHGGSAAGHRVAHAEAVGDPAGMHREQQRERGE